MSVLSRIKRLIQPSSEASDAFDQLPVKTSRSGPLDYPPSGSLEAEGKQEPQLEAQESLSADAHLKQADMPNAQRAKEDGDL